MGCFASKKNIMDKNNSLGESCGRCKRGVITGVKYNGKVYHRECFTCHNCGKVLSGVKFFSEKGIPYCLICFPKLFAERCHSCGRPIFGLGDAFQVSQGGKKWHVACFVCSKCHEQLLGELSITTKTGVVCVDCAGRACA